MITSKSILKLCEGLTPNLRQKFKSKFNKGDDYSVYDAMSEVTSIYNHNPSKVSEMIKVWNLYWPGFKVTKDDFIEFMKEYDLS